MVPVESVRAGLAIHPTKLPLAFGNLVLDQESGIAIAGDLAASLSPQPAKLLAAFMLNQDGVLSKSAAFDALYWNKRGDIPNGKVIDQWIFLLRLRLERLGYGIKSIRGFGWRLREK